MEFTCVFSVSGSLVSYRLKKEKENKYTASLQTTPTRQPGIPDEMVLEKSGTEWVASPHQPEILTHLVYCIEAHFTAASAV